MRGHIIQRRFIGMMVGGALLCGLGWGTPMVRSESDPSREAKESKKSVNYKSLIVTNLELRDQLKELQKEYGDLESGRNTLIMRLKDLQKENDWMKSVAEGLDLEDRDRLQEELSKAKERLGNLDQIISKKVEDRVIRNKKDLEKQQQNLQEKLEKVVAENTRLIQEIEEAQKSFEEARVQKELELGKALTSSSRLEKKLAQVSTEREVLEGVARDAEARAKKLIKRELKSSDQLKRQLRAEIQALKKGNKENKESEKRLEWSHPGTPELTALKREVDMHFNLAVMYDQSGFYKQGEEEYLKCLELNPHDADVYYNLAILYDDKLNDNFRAVDYYKKFLELRPVGEDGSLVRQWILLAEEESRIGPEVR